jgi:ubiquinol-cytochrome c reductase iron-sulfur subunit
MNERAVLTALTTAFIAIGLVLAAIPFVASMRAADEGSGASPYVDVPIATVLPGEFAVVEIGKRPVAVVRANADMLRALHDATSRTWSGRAPVPSAGDFFVFSFESTYRGCLLQHRPKATTSSPDSWTGGFYDPCHVGAWDYAGRALRSSAQLRDLLSGRVELRAPDTLRIYVDGLP